MQQSLRASRPMLWTARVGAFVALGVVVGLALAPVPNVELVTATSFVSGVLLGPAAGLATGALVELVFAGFHPMGSSMGFLLLAQMMGMSVAGLMGGLVAPLILTFNAHHSAIFLVVSGGICTIVFDLITNLAWPLVSRMSTPELSFYLLAALPFAAVHLVSNVIVFSVIVVPLIPRLKKVIALS